jgi:hypothetical protein
MRGARPMSASFRFCPRAEIDRAEWDGFVESNDEAWIWHRSEFIDARSLWSDYVDVSFGVRDAQGHLLAILPLYLITSKYSLGRRQAILSLGMREGTFKWLLSDGGPAIIGAERPQLRRKVLTAMKSRLPELIEGYCARHLEARVAALAPFLSGPHAPHVNPLYELDFQDASWATWVIDLTVPIEEVRRRYSLATRQLLKKAGNESFSLREAAGSKDLEEYYKLHVETIERKTFNAVPSMSFEFFRHIFDHILPKKFARIVFLQKNGRLIGANNTVFYKRGAYYWTAASRMEKDQYEGRVLFDNQLAHAHHSGCVQIDAGQAYIPGTGAFVRGTSEFKRTFGSEMVPFYRGHIRAPEKKPSGLMSVLSRAVGR